MIKDDYTAEISILSSKIEKIKAKLTKYQTLLDNLTLLNSDLPNAKSKLNIAISKCIDGGFNDKGNPFGNGLMEESLNNLDYIISEINDLISKNTEKIGLLKNELDGLNSKIRRLKTLEA